MEFSLLGPVTATDDEHGELPLGPPKRRSVLAMLLLQPNTTVSVEQLTASVWEEEPPAHARTVIQGHVSKLRATLAEAGAAAHGVELTTRGSAYRLRLPATLVDAHRFSELAASARPEEDPGRAVGLLQEALSLWRGPALTGTVTSPPLAAAAHALEERRLAAVETLAAAYGTLGDHDRAAAVLSAEAVTHPLREGLVAALMLALYRAGRQSDALDRYHHTRRLLADELGVDPGERLRAAYQSILAGDSPPADRQPPRRGTVPPPGRPGGAPPRAAAPAAFPHPREAAAPPFAGPAAAGPAGSRPGHPADGRPAAPGAGPGAPPPGGPAGAGQVPGVPGPARHTPPPAAPPGVPTGPAGGVPAAPAAPPAYPGTPPPVPAPAAPGGDTPAGLAPGTPPGPGVPLGPGVDPATGTAGAPWGVHGRTGTAPAAQVPWAPGSGAEPPATGAGAGGGAAPSPQLLPRPPAGFLGRAAELDQLTRLALPGAAGPGTADSALVLVTGPAGVGKTALAVRWAHSHAEAFPHGRLFADLRGFGGGEEARPGQVLREFLLALGVEAGRIPESADAAAALYRSIAADRALLVVLDNAHSSAQVRPLLPAGPYCVTLVTSRSRLDGLVATDSARSVRLHALDIEEGVALLGAVLGQDRVTEDPAAARELVALCNGLPLALRAAAAQLTARPRWRLARLAAALRDERKRLALLSAEDTGVAAALRASVARLSADDVRLLATLGSSFAREVDAGAVAALAGSDPELTRDALDRLAEVHLIDEEATNRYVMSDLVKLFAQEGKDRPGPGERPG